MQHLLHPHPSRPDRYPLQGSSSAKIHHFIAIFAIRSHPGTLFKGDIFATQAFGRAKSHLHPRRWATSVGEILIVCCFPRSTIQPLLVCKSTYIVLQYSLFWLAKAPILHSPPVAPSFCGTFLIEAARNTRPAMAPPGCRIARSIHSPRWRPPWGRVVF